MIKVDTCGQSCPQPVLLTKKAISNNPKDVEIITDNNTATTNVKKFLSSNGYNVSISTQNDNTYIVKGTK